MKRREANLGHGMLENIMLRLCFKRDGDPDVQESSHQLCYRCETSIIVFRKLKL